MACLAPNTLADGTEVACRECKLCQLKARNDWVGRNIAESKTSKFSYLITATYGRGRVGEILHERAVILTYSDCQKFLKLLRRHGYDVRFFITGEYGSERGRAHWNIILYSNEPLPAFAGWDQYGRWLKKARMEQRFNWVRTNDKGEPVMLQSGEPAYWWPHGFVHIGDVSLGNIRYACKYVLKDFDGNGKQGHKGQSKDPPLGTEWFRQLAEKYVEQGLAPQSPEYRFPEAKTKQGEPVRFWLKGRSLELYLQHFIDTWAERRGDEPRPPSKFVDDFEEYGRVVNDEQKMLTRKAFPKGEALRPVPPMAVQRELAEKARVRRAEREWSEEQERKETERDEWRTAWLKGAKDGEERQKRERLNDADRKRSSDERLGAKHKRYPGHIWQFGVGWRASGEQCECGWTGHDVQPDIVQSNPGESAWGVQRHEQSERLGRVGRYNRDYGEAGPGETDTDTRPASRGRSGDGSQAR